VWAISVNSSAWKKRTQDLEGVIGGFCHVAKPLLTYFIVNVVAWGFLLSVALFGRFHGSSSFIDSIVRVNYKVFYLLCLLLPALIISLRGRQRLSRTLTGIFPWWAAVAFGTLAGVGTTTFSYLLNRCFFSVSLAPFPNFNLDNWIPLVFAPFSEEMLYQAGLQTWLQRFGPVVAIGVTTVLFEIPHFFAGSLEAWVLDVFPALLTFAVIRQVTKSLGAAMIAHGTYNLLILQLLLYRLH